ncbi:MAG: hypothetical protein AAF358_04660 [Pseudomonadota bacterium]
MRIIQVITAALLLVCFGVGAETIDIPDGDTVKLVNTLCTAQASGTDELTLVLAERGNYRLGPRRRWLGCLLGGRAGTIPIPPGAATVSAKVTILGRGATLDLGETSGFVVEPGGSLVVEDLELRNGDLFPALVNRGETVFRRVGIVNWRQPYNSDRGFVAPVVNFGSLTLANTLLAGNALAEFPLEGFSAESLGECATPGSAGVYNEGDLTLNNVTATGNFVALPEGQAFPTSWICGARDLVTMATGVSLVSNTLLTSSSLDSAGVLGNCSGRVTSLGYNNVPGGLDCGFDGTDDRVSESFVRTSLAEQNGRQLPAYRSAFSRISDGSPSRPPASGACETKDIRGFERRSGDCVRGALDPLAVPAFDSSFDGLWFDQQQDGQYLQISHFGANRALITWLGFDGEGEQVWVYGVAESGNTVIQFDAFRNSGIRAENGTIDGQLAAKVWGELNVRVDSCSNLSLTVTPAGEFPSVYRLARITDGNALDCFDFVEFDPL